MPISASRRAGGHGMQTAAVPKFSSPRDSPLARGECSPHRFLKKGDGDRIKLGMLKKPEPPSAPPRLTLSARTTLPTLSSASLRSWERGDLPVAVEHKGMKNVIS